MRDANDEDQWTEEAIEKTRRLSLGDDSESKRLCQLIQVQEQAELWGKTYPITPCFVYAYFGDGKQLLGVGTINHRPNYYVIRVDSSWEISDRSSPVYVGEFIDEVLDAIEDQYSTLERELEYLRDTGSSAEEAEEMAGWPAMDGFDGVYWFDLPWPKGWSDRQQQPRAAS